MADNIVKQLNDISVTNTYKLHDLLDKVLGIQFVIFPGNEIKFDQDRVAFVSTVGEYTLVVQRDMNTFTVVARVIKDNLIMAECVVSVVGDFNEKYGRMDAEMKGKVSTWFTEIGAIDVNILATGPAPEPEENVSEEAVEATEESEPVPETESN